MLDDIPGIYRDNYHDRNLSTGGHRGRCPSRIDEQVATSRRARRPSRDNYCAFDRGTIVEGSCESHTYRENDWRVGGLAERRYLRDPSRPVQPMRFTICDDRLGHQSRTGQALGQEGSERCT